METIAVSPRGFEIREGAPKNAANVQRIQFQEQKSAGASMSSNPTTKPMGGAGSTLPFSITWAETGTLHNESSCHVYAPCQFYN